MSCTPPALSHNQFDDYCSLPDADDGVVHRQSRQQIKFKADVDDSSMRVAGCVYLGWMVKTPAGGS